MELRIATLEKKLRVVRREWPHVEQHMQLRTERLRAVVEKDPERNPVRQDYEFKHRGHTWLCMTTVSAETSSSYALYWWLSQPNGRPDRQVVDAIQLRGHEKPLHFDHHFFGRYGKRHVLLRERLINMFIFFKQHPALRMQDTGLWHRGHRAVAGAVSEGLVHAVHGSPNLISCGTFLDHRHMRPDEQALWRKLMRMNGQPVEIPHPAALGARRPMMHKVVRW